MSINAVTDNPVLRDMHARLRTKLKERFPALRDCGADDYLALTKYLSGTPHRFFSEDIYLSFLSWLLERDSISRTSLQLYVSDHEVELTAALMHLEEMNGLGWHDHFEQLDDYELIRFIDRDVHPVYLRLSEAVLLPFLRIAAHFSRKDRGKGTDGLDIRPVTEELKRSSLETATLSYKPTIRNGIAHGGITYLEKEIRYRDKKGNQEKLSDSGMVCLVDNMFDTCNALALAISVFLLVGRMNGYILPRQLLLEELKEETKTPWWEITGCTPSEFSGLNQLIIYARPRTSDYGKVQISTFHSGVLAEKYAPGYDRYFVSIRSTASWPGWAAFDGRKLRLLRENRAANLQDYAGVIEDNLVFYVPRWRMPQFLSRYQTLYYSIRLNWPGVMADYRDQMNWPEVIVRQSAIHRNAWGSVLQSDVFIDTHSVDLTQDVVRKACRRIVNKSLRQARRNTSRFNVLRYLPLGFAQINLFRRDYRRRRLSSFGLGSDLIATVRVQRIQRIKSPDILGSTIEFYGRYRIAWNKAWLEETKMHSNSVEQAPDM